MQLGPHLLQGPQTLAQGPTRRQRGRLRRESEASIRLLGRRWQALEADHVAAWREQAGSESDASWAPAQGAAWLCTSDPLKGRQDWARALLHRGHPHAPGPWPPRKTRDQKPAREKRHHIATASASEGGVALKGTIQASRSMRFVMAGGLKAGYTPPIFQDVEPRRHLLLQQLRSRQAFPFDCQDYCGLVGALEPSVIRTDMWIPFPAAGQSFADFARRAHVSSHRWRSAVLATPPVLDADTAEIILPSVDAFQVQASGMTLQERSKGTKTSRSVDDFLDAPSLSAFNALTNTVRNGTHGFGRHLPTNRPPICLGSLCVPWWVMRCILKTITSLLHHQFGTFPCAA